MDILKLRAPLTRAHFGSQGPTLSRHSDSILGPHADDKHPHGLTMESRKATTISSKHLDRTHMRAQIVIKIMVIDASSYTYGTG